MGGACGGRGGGGSGPAGKHKQQHEVWDQGLRALSAWAGMDLTLRAADVTELLPAGGGNTEMTNEHLVGVSSA